MTTYFQVEKPNNKRHRHLIEMKYRVGENWFKSIQMKKLLMFFTNKHLPQRQVLNFSIKCDEASEIVNTITTLKRYFTITLLSHLPLPISRTRSHMNQINEL
jgi:hypothetical protein